MMMMTLLGAPSTAHDPIAREWIDWVEHHTHDPTPFDPMTQDKVQRAILEMRALGSP